MYVGREAPNSPFLGGALSAGGAWGAASGCKNGCQHQQKQRREQGLYGDPSRQPHTAFVVTLQRCHDRWKIWNERNRSPFPQRVDFFPLVELPAQLAPVAGRVRRKIKGKIKGDAANSVRPSDCSNVILCRQRRLGRVLDGQNGCQGVTCRSAVCDARSVERLGSRRLRSSFRLSQRFFAASSSARCSFARCASTSSVVAQPIMCKQIIS